MGAVIWTIVVPILLVLFGLAVAVFGQALFETDYKFGPIVSGTLIALIGLGIFGFNSFTTVPPRNVGVQVEFGKPTASLENGFHWVAPWSSIETVDATVQNINLNTDIGLWNTGACTAVTVRLANQTTACVDVTVQWNVDRHANASELWQKYRGNNDDVVKNVGHNVVDRQMRVALNEVFENYNPLAVLATGEKSTTTTLDLANKALGILKQNVEAGIQVDVLTIPLVHYDAVTQGKLNGFAQALADTQIATQQKLTAEQQKLANEKLAVSSSNDPGVKYQNCLNMIKDLAAKGQLQNLQYGGLMCSTGNNSLIVGK